MIRHVTEYFTRLAATFGDGWTRFWFTPSDPTTLSAMRLLTGLVVVYLHATLALDLMQLFGPGGLLPAAEIRPLEAGNFSYLNYLSTPGELWAAYGLGLAILVLFAAGFWTRITSVLGLVVFLSDVNRAPVITLRTEPIVAAVMLYLCLGPCGRRFSIDRLLARRAAAKAMAVDRINELSTTATIATRLIQVHLALWIAMMGLSKLPGEVWWTGVGTWLLIARKESTLVDLTALRSTPLVIEFWSHAVVMFEMAFPILIWVPLARPLLLAIGVIIWGSLALATGELTWAVMMCVASMAFISPAFVRSCVDRRRAPPIAA
jgi:hypothetical protein